MYLSRHANYIFILFIKFNFAACVFAKKYGYIFLWGTLIRRKYAHYQVGTEVRPIS